MNVKQRYIELVESINNAATEAEHARRQAVLEGFRIALQASGWTEYGMGCLVMAADDHYLTQGQSTSRPMCGGVWLDWEPATCPTCHGSGSIQEDHGLGAVETLGCQHFAGSGKRGPTP